MNKVSIEMLSYEKKLWDQGVKLVAGVDEVGRGPLAGPVVAAAVIFPPDLVIPEINDSKKLSAKKREEFFEIISQNALGVGIGIVREKMIDRINILNASFVAMAKALDKLPLSPEFVLVDGNHKIPHLSISQMPIIKGDGLSQTIAAASIIAKVTRDKIMCRYHKKYPDFCFAQNKGYSTKSHLKALNEFGPCKIHRMSFKQVILVNTNQEELSL